jgi:hypothetical protein
MLCHITRKLLPFTALLIEHVPFKTRPNIITTTAEELNQKQVHPRVTDSPPASPVTLESRSSWFLGRRCARAVQVRTWYIHEQKVGVLLSYSVLPSRDTHC